MDLPDLGATRAFAARLAALLEPGDAVLLEGELGSGKTELARATLRARAGDPGLEVPSPTYTLVQRYELPGGLALLHADLYRVRSALELRELGLDAALAEGAALLVEWPDRAPPGLWPADRRLGLRLGGPFPGGPPGRRRLAVAPGPGWAARARSLVP